MWLKKVTIKGQNGHVGVTNDHYLWMMIRFSTLVGFGLLLGCSSQPGDGEATRGAAKSATPRRPSSDALAARQVTQRYFDLLRSGHYGAALALWGEDTATHEGGVQPFATAMRAQGRLDGRAGDPSAAQDNGAVRYMLVEATADLVSPKGKTSDLFGTVMLRRPIQAGGAWRIWGTDLRPRRCRAGQVAQGLGCV